MVIYTDDLEELLSLSFPLAAALEGMNVHLYFQGPGGARPLPKIQAQVEGMGPTLLPVRRFLRTCALACAHRDDEAIEARAKLIELLPGFSLSDHLERLPFRDSGRRDVLERCMRAARLPG